MKATGIVRRIDDLGRVVIPKEIRRTMRIREGDPLEIFTDREGEVIFKKYSPMGELSETAATFCEVLVKSAPFSVIICDRDHCIAAGGIPKKEVLERRVTTALEDVMEGRRPYVADPNDKAPFFALEGISRPVAVAVPIVSAGDVAGAVVFLGDEKGSAPSENDKNLAVVAAGFLGKNMEDF